MVPLLIGAFYGRSERRRRGQKGPGCADDRALGGAVGFLALTAPWLRLDPRSPPWDSYARVRQADKSICAPKGIGPCAPPLFSLQNGNF
jgi:hypothetical protein